MAFANKVRNGLVVRHTGLVGSGASVLDARRYRRRKRAFAGCANAKSISSRATRHILLSLGETGHLQL